MSFWLASNLTRHSALSGGFCFGPLGCSGSKRGAPPGRYHWPLRFGYFESSKAAALVAVITIAASPIALKRLLYIMLSSDSCHRLRLDRGYCPPCSESGGYRKLRIKA